MRAYEEEDDDDDDDDTDVGGIEAIFVVVGGGDMVCLCLPYVLMYLRSDRVHIWSDGWREMGGQRRRICSPKQTATDKQSEFTQQQLQQHMNASKKMIPHIVV